jgi:hypothetical protein
MKTLPPRDRITLCLVLCLLLSPFTAQAFDVKGLQPLSPYGVFSSFSAESLPHKSVGIGLGVERSMEPHFYRTTLQMAYGLHDKVEINASLPYVINWGESLCGAEDLSIGLKHRVLDETKYTPAVAYMLTASVPFGRNEFSTDGSYGGGLLVTKKVGPFKGHLNLLYSNPGKAELHDEYSMNLGAELAVSHNSKILAELVGRKNYFMNKIDLLEWRLGYRVATRDYLFTSVGVGFDIKEREPHYRFLVTVGIILPPARKDVRRIYEESPSMISP